MDLSIIPECYVDTNLIETLVPPQKGYNHQKGCPNVARVMQQKFSDRFALGIIDKDKKQLKYLGEFNLVAEKASLQLYKHKLATKHHYIIVVAPAVEQWIIETAQSVNLSLSDYGLPTNLAELTKVTKTITSKNDSKFKQLFKDLVQHNAENAQCLKNWLKYLKENAYNVNIQQLTNL
jgi:hypothetical protein